MKQLLIIPLLLIICNSARAQITLEHTETFNYSNNANNCKIFYQNFSESGWKFVVLEYENSNIGRLFENLRTIKIYNLDYSHWRSINIPQYPNYTASIRNGMNGGYDEHIHLSDALFDNDGSTVEALISYGYDYDNAPVPNPGTKLDWHEIIDETGRIRMTITGDVNMFYSGNGKCKLIEFMSSDSGRRITGVKIYSLPGSLPCDGCNGAPAGNKPISSDGIQGFMLSDPVPNPSGKETSIAYRLPQPMPGSKLQLFDVNGAVLRSYPLQDSNGSLQVDVSTLPPGHYFYQIKTAVGNSSAKKMLVIK